ncbi:MAG TPA: ThuA domain-containing protein [Povalibacter sp.]
MKNTFVALLTALLALSVASGVHAKAPPKPIRVLIVDGFNNHDWRLTTHFIRGILEPTGLFAIDVSTSPADAAASGWDEWRPPFEKYDVIIQNCNDYGGGPSWPVPVQKSFERFVRRGGGVYIWHSANNAFPQWPEYNDMIGLGWRKKDYGTAVAVGDDGKLIRFPPGEGENTGHGPRFDALITRVGDYPLHRDLPRQWTAADIEVYYHVRGPAKNLEVLSYAHEPKTQLNWPTEWLVTYGRGKVYTSNFGHVWKGDTQPVTVRDIGVQTLLVRAVQWLADRPVDFPVPANFPTATSTSVGPPLD